MTRAEKILWNELRASKLCNLKLKRQHSIGNYIPDFYCAQLQLVIEPDGAVHFGKEQKEKDKERDKNLQAMNFTVLRITNNEIEKDLNWLQRIENISREKGISENPKGV